MASCNSLHHPYDDPRVRLPNLHDAEALLAAAAYASYSSKCIRRAVSHQRLDPFRGGCDGTASIDF